MELTAEQNPILNSDKLEVFDVNTLHSASVFVRPKKAADKRTLIDMRRMKTAEEAIAPLTKRNELYGFTKGQFSILDLIKAALKKTGPARFTISTWTAAKKEIVDIETLLATGAILKPTRWLVDYTFARRDKAALHQIRKVFGADSVRVANTHSKFCLFENDAWRLVLRSSMNLNMNPRFEDFTLAHDPDVAGFIERILTEIWSKQSRSLADDAAPGEFLQFFQKEM